jgi:hypothetical protein
MDLNLSLKKQLILNKLNIPDVLIDIIKDYLFYDCVSSKSRFYKTKSSNIIQNAPVSRNTCILENGEYWAIGLYNYFEVNFAGRNCKKCGEYQILREYLPQNIECYCMPDLIDIDIEEDYDEIPIHYYLHVQ